MLLAFFIGLTAWLLAFILPWWSVAIPGLLFGAWLGRTGASAFLWGFIGIGGLWLVQSLYIDIANNGILAARIARLFSLPSPVLVILLTVIIGGLIGGLTTLTGYLFRKVFNTQVN